MNVVICIIVGLIALLAGFALGHRRDEPTIFLELIEKINFAMGTENKTLKEENETLKKKKVFLIDWFIRSYIEQYYLKKLGLGEYQIYTTDALKEFKEYSEIALNNFEKTWNSEICNEQCEWTKEYLENFISKVDSILNDEWGSDVLNRENEHALKRFFAGIELNMMFDRDAKQSGRETKELTYWHPHPQIGYEDLC